MLGQIVDWFYGQIVGFLGNFFSEMGNMGAELFAMSWVQSVVLFFSYLGWALFATGLVVACFECGVEYSSGRGNVKETALNAIKGFLAVSLFTQVPVRLYVLAVSLQADLTAGITGFGATSIGDAAKAALEDFNAVESLTTATSFALRGFGPVTSGLMVIFCLALMAYAVIKVFFANLKRGGILLIQIAVGSLYKFTVSSVSLSELDTTQQIAIPQQLLGQAGIDSNAEVQIACIDGAIIITGDTPLTEDELSEVVGRLRAVNDLAEHFANESDTEERGTSYGSF